MGKKLDYKIPFCGNTMQRYVGGWRNPAAHLLTWRDNHPFEATVKLDGHYRGRSSVRIDVINISTSPLEKYSMGIAGFYEAVALWGVQSGCIRGTWVFRKQGSDYGLYPWEG
jgi:hypothetical protein